MKLLPRGVKRQIERLNSLTTGPGAIKLPPKVTRLELRFHKQVGEASVGAKRFWRQTLPPIQFYNPQIPISVRRFNTPSPNANTERPELRVEFEDGSVKTVDASNQPKEAILSQLLKLTGAEQIPTSERVLLRTAEEEQQLLQQSLHSQSKEQSLPPKAADKSHQPHA